MARYDAVFARGNLRRRFGFHTDPLTLGIETSPGSAKAPSECRAECKSGYEKWWLSERGKAGHWLEVLSMP